MKRYAFYFGISLVSFSIGLIVVSFLYLKITDKTSERQNSITLESDKTPLEKAKTKQPELVWVKMEDLPCEDKILKLVWNKFKDEELSIDSERAESIKNCSDIVEWFELNDLNNDEKKEIFIRGIYYPFRCGNNCSKYWIFGTIKGQGYQKIFEAEGYLPVISKSKTLGYRNITFEFYASYVEFINGTYTFNGTEYVLKNCWKESKLVKNKDGELVEGKKWKTIPRKCN